jgi:protein SCO1/2
MKRIIILLLSFLLLACSKPAFKGADITNGPIGGNFVLSDHHGKTRNLTDFKGKVVVLFFGFTQCPDVCPTTLSELKNSMTQLGVDAKEVQVLFVSVDPERDSKAILSEYVPAFHPDFLGLSGTTAQLEHITKAYRVVYQKQVQGNSYTVDHSAGSYLIDKQGNARVMINYGAGADAFTHDIKLLLAE